MKNHKRKISYVFLALFLIAVFAVSWGGLSFAQNTNGKSLEITYPSVTGVTTPTSTNTSLPDYIRYIFNFIITFAGFIAFVALALGGYRYLTSAGNPGNESLARSQIFSALFGIVLLLGSFILFNIINPKILSPNLENLPEIQMPETAAPPVYYEQTADLLQRVKELMQALQKTPDTVVQTGNNLKSYTDKCDCRNTKPICGCEGNDGKTMACKPQTCFSGETFHPCPDKNNIESAQKSLISQRDITLYYKERVIKEKEDMVLDIKTINDRISFFQKNIDEENKKAGPSQKTLDYLNERRDWLEEELQYKSQIVPLLENLSGLVGEIASPSTKLSGLASQCFYNVKDKCQASCKQGNSYGCHDKTNGCVPDKCSGGNPCPTSEIQAQLSKLSSIPPKIRMICDQVISIIDNIKKQRQIKNISL